MFFIFAGWSASRMLEEEKEGWSSLFNASYCFSPWDQSSLQQCLRQSRLEKEKRKIHEIKSVRSMLGWIKTLSNKTLNTIHWVIVWYNRLDATVYIDPFCALALAGVFFFFSLLEIQFSSVFMVSWWSVGGLWRSRLTTLLSSGNEMLWICDGKAACNTQHTSAAGASCTGSRSSWKHIRVFPFLSYLSYLSFNTLALYFGGGPSIQVSKSIVWLLPFC